MASRRRRYGHATRTVAALALPLLSLSAARCQEPRPEDVYKAALPSVATLAVEKADGTQVLGTTFMAIRDGLAVTAWHVVNGAKRAAVRFSSGEEFDVSGLVDRDEKRDVALIRAKVFGRPMLALSPTDPAVGSRAYVIGAPKGLEFSVSEGLVSQLQTLDGVRCYQFTCPVSPGNSGGPLLSARGDVLGVVRSSLQDGQNLNFATPSCYVLGLDSSLPTQPWPDVRPGTALVAANGTDPAKADEAIVNAVVLAVDASTAVLCTLELFRKPAFRETFSWRTMQHNRDCRLFTPAFLLTTQRDIDMTRRQMQQLPVEGARAKLRDHLASMMQAYSQSIQGLIDMIRVVQERSGWTTEANELASRSVALLPREDQRKGLETAVAECAKSDGFAQRVPEDLKAVLHVSSDPRWFQLGVLTFVREPLHFVSVKEGGIARGLGFADGDHLLEFAGVKPDSGLALRALIAANRGREVSALVTRDGKQIRLKVRVPRELVAK